MFLGVYVSQAQTEAPAAKIYNPGANAKEDVANAVSKALKEGKNVLIQVGGNWCPWCIKLHKFMGADSELQKTLDENYVFVLVNHSKENKNEEVLESLGFPQRFGFPVLVVLDSKGKTIHIQDSGYLELDKSYDKAKLMRFLKLWTPKAVSNCKS